MLWGQLTEVRRGAKAAAACKGIQQNDRGQAVKWAWRRLVQIRRFDLAFEQNRPSPDPLLRQGYARARSLELGYAIWPTSAQAQAQCSSSGNPAPPPPVEADFSNRSFGTTPPLTPYGVRSSGLAGCNGADGSYGDDGTPGSPGQGGARVASNNSGLTIIGGGPPGPGFFTVGAFQESVGGSGGNGGQGGYASDVGGQGGAGGAGDNLRVGFGGTFVPGPGGSLATTALTSNSLGGSGGTGGGSTSGGIYAKQAGDGGAGGAGGSAALIAGGSVRADAHGVWVRSLGGSGGDGGSSSSTDKLDTTAGGNGGVGGSAGAASLQWLSGTVMARSRGLLAIADGGRAGVGGTAYWNLITSSGGNGGVGGNGGQASVLLSSGTIAVEGGYPGGSGIYVAANGGDGGDGGQSYYATDVEGGSGGNGGSGGAASAAVAGTVIYNGASSTSEVTSHGVLVQANGGGGGKGANASAIEGDAGGGGFAGAGGSATLTLGSPGQSGHRAILGMAPSCRASAAAAAMAAGGFLRHRWCRRGRRRWWRSRSMVQCSERVRR